MSNPKFSEKLVNFKIDSDVYERIFSIARELHGHGGIKKLYNELSKDVVRKYDSGKNGMEKFFDQSFIPKPDIDSDFDKNILPWLRTRINEDLNKLRISSYRTFVYSQGLLDTPPDQRLTIDFDYETLWKRYRW